MKSVNRAACSAVTERTKRPNSTSTVPQTRFMRSLSSRVRQDYSVYGLTEYLLRGEEASDPMVPTWNGDGTSTNWPKTLARYEAAVGGGSQARLRRCDLAKGRRS